MMDLADSETPLLDELEKGPWPSFVKEMKRMAKPYANAILKQAERSYKDKRTHWKHGGIVGVKGYGAGVIGRYSDLPEMETPDVHTLRVVQPAAWFYKTEYLRKLCDIWEKYGSGFTNFHGSTGDIILLGARSDDLQPCFNELSDAGFDLGGSGGDVRSLSCCTGPALCEWSCFDTMDLYHELTKEFQDEIHRPRYPYKFKFKISGCPNDCVAAIARSDLAIVGTWRDPLRIDQKMVRDYQKEGTKVGDICGRCPTNAIAWNGKKLEEKPRECVRCMYCLNSMPGAVLPGRETGATLLLGGKATILNSAFLGWVLVPFIKVEKPYTELKTLFRKILDWFDENAKTRERTGEVVYRLGMSKFLHDIGLPPLPQMVSRPRANPYYFWKPEELEAK
jgi:sulfite reductase alpha subunit